MTRSRSHTGRNATSGTEYLFAVLIATGIFTLAGCTGGKDTTSTSGAKSTQTTSKKTASARKYGGGFYKDDGPGDDEPFDLAAIPDAVPKNEPLHRFANQPYVVLGKEYVPQARLGPYKARGVASWYGKKFHGQKTAIGEIYDMYGMTAAHPTLPLPSYVRVYNPANGYSVVVRVNDRGPFHAGRIIDLSWTAAAKLDLLDKGSGVVEVETVFADTPRPDPVGPRTAVVVAHTKPLAQLPAENIGPVAAPPPAVQEPPPAIQEPPPAIQEPPPAIQEPPPAAQENDVEPENADDIANLLNRLEAETSAVQTGGNQSPPGSIYLQLGAFSSNSNAQSLRDKIDRDLDWLSDPIRINKREGLFRVQLGPYATRDEAERLAARIDDALGYRPTFVLTP